MQQGVNLRTAQGIIVPNNDFWRGTFFVLCAYLTSNESEANKAKIRKAISSAKTPDELRERLEQTKVEILSQNISTDPVKSEQSVSCSNTTSLDSSAAIKGASQSLRGNGGLIAAPVASVTSSDTKNDGNQLSDKTNVIKRVLSVIEFSFKQGVGEEQEKNVQLNFMSFDDKQNIKLKACFPKRYPRFMGNLFRQFMKNISRVEILGETCKTYDFGEGIVEGDTINVTTSHICTLQNLETFLEKAIAHFTNRIAEVEVIKEERAIKGIKKFTDANVIPTIRSALNDLKQLTPTSNDGVIKKPNHILQL